MFIPVIRIKGNAGYGLLECTVLVFLVFSYGVINGLLMGGKTVRKHLEHCKDHQILFYKYTYIIDFRIWNFFNTFLCVFINFY